MKKLRDLLAKGIIAVALVGGLSQFAEAGEKTVGIEAGMIDGQVAVGTSLKMGKYTTDVHVGVGEENKSAIAVGVYRDVLTLDQISLGVGLDANKVVEETKRSIKTRVYQGYGLQLNYKFEKFNVRGTINSNGDAKVGVGFSF